MHIGFLVTLFSYAQLFLSARVNFYFRDTVSERAFGPLVSLRRKHENVYTWDSIGRFLLFNNN